MKTLGIHVFRRDLRLEDNTALNALAKTVDVVLPVFVFDPRQVGEHPYRGAHGLQILAESLEDLDGALREKGASLHVRTGVAEDVLEALIRELKPTTVSFNKDYTPFSVARDDAMRAVCEREGLAVIDTDDATIQPPESVLTKEGKPYSVYTRYRIAVEMLPVPNPKRLPAAVSFHESTGGIDLAAYLERLVPERAELRVTGGRTAAKDQLRRISSLSSYAAQRNFPSVSGTSLLSAHIKFGTLSIREIYLYAKTHMKDPTVFLREILWHDFFTAVAARAPHVFQGAYRPEYDRLEWSTDEKAFTRWKEGKTGFPIVDAGMRELLGSGYMHNRVRMITASFLIKDLHISWQWGEKHFAQQLNDYDPAVNNGNWQWVAGTGCDAAPWFRIFNPWLQQEKFDKDAAYIKKWVPELAGLSPAEIHNQKGEARLLAGYPAPMLDHREESQETKHRYGIAKQLQPEAREGYA
ncbi:MAG: deoxyribodipyrimidine photo-lyase [Patescibacteria group bacterium]